MANSNVIFIYVFPVFLVPKLTFDCGNGNSYFDLRIQFSHHVLRKCIKCVFLHGYVFNIKNFPCDKILFSFQNNIHFESAFAKLQNEYKLHYVCLSVSPFVRQSYRMELGSSGRIYMKNEFKSFRLYLENIYFLIKSYYNNEYLT